MKQIRNGVFETNSSSMHSLAIMKRDDRYTPEEILKGIYRLYDDEETGEKECVWNIWDDLHFGRSPFRALGTFTDKWLYACASLVHEYNDDVYKELVEIALKYVPGLKKIKLQTTTGTIYNKDHEDNKDDDYIQKYGKTESEFMAFLDQKEKEWGMELDYWESNGCWHFDEPDIGYVDEDILSGFLKNEGITLEDFLINKKYVVIQDGDEFYYYADMKEAGLINMDAIDHEYFPPESYVGYEED